MFHSRVRKRFQACEKHYCAQITCAHLVLRAINTQLTHKNKEWTHRISQYLRTIVRFTSLERLAQSRLKHCVSCAANAWRYLGLACEFVLVWYNYVYRTICMRKWTMSILTKAFIKRMIRNCVSEFSIRKGHGGKHHHKFYCTSNGIIFLLWKKISLLIWKWRIPADPPYNLA